MGKTKIDSTGCSLTTAAWTSNIGLISFSIAALIYLQAQGPAKHRNILQTLAFSIFTLGTLACSLGMISLIQGPYIAAPSGLLLTVSLSLLTVIAHLFFKMPMVGTYSAPLCTLILLIEFFSQPTQPLTESAGGVASTWLLFGHVAVSLVGEAFAIGCCVISILYLIQQRALKQKRMDSLGAGTPTLDLLDKLLFWGLWLGFIGITVGLVTGAIYSQFYVPRSQGRLEIKIYWAIAVWIWYLATLLARNVFGRSVRQIARMCLAGFLLLLSTFFGLMVFHPLGGS